MDSAYNFIILSLLDSQDQTLSLINLHFGLICISSRVIHKTIKKCETLNHFCNSLYLHAHTLWSMCLASYWHPAACIVSQQDLKVSLSHQSYHAHAKAQSYTEDHMYRGAVRHPSTSPDHAQSGHVMT
jgi:hypothetical protein